MRSRNRSGNVQVIIFICVLMFGAATTAVADGDEQETDRGTGYYVTGMLGGSWADFDASGTNDLAGADNSGTATDSSFMGGAALGAVLALGSWDLRLELEGIGGRSYEFSLPSPSGSGSYSVDADLWTLQGNFWFSYPLSNLLDGVLILDKIAVFGGGGLGLSHHKLSASDGAVSGSNSDDTFAWQAGFGLSYEYSPKLAVDLRYSYIDMGGPTIDLSNAGGSQGSLDIDFGGNEIFGGIRLTFAGR